jgi:hypothetical protein
MKYPKRSQYKHAKSPYRIRNWAEYEASLRRRGDLNSWLSNNALLCGSRPVSGAFAAGPTGENERTLRPARRFLEFHRWYLPTSWTSASM